MLFQAPSKIYYLIILFNEYKNDDFRNRPDM
jgi:hypothetical protein